MKILIKLKNFIKYIYKIEADVQYGTFISCNRDKAIKDNWEIIKSLTLPKGK